MSHYKWIVLRNSVEQAAWEGLTTQQRSDALNGYNYTNFQGKKYRVVFPGWKPNLSKDGETRKTLGAKLDRVEGPVWYTCDLTVRTKQTMTTAESNAKFGTLAELEAYFKNNNPQPGGGQPSNLITFMDFYGTDRDGYLTGSLSPENLTVVIEGTEAHYFVQLHFEAVTAEVA